MPRYTDRIHGSTILIYYCITILNYSTTMLILLHRCWIHIKSSALVFISSKPELYEEKFNKKIIKGF